MIRWSLIWARKFHDVWTVLFMLENLFSSRTTRLKFFEISTHFLLGALHWKREKFRGCCYQNQHFKSIFKYDYNKKKVKKALRIFCFSSKIRLLFLLLPYNDNFWQALYAVCTTKFLFMEDFFFWIFRCLLKNCSEYIIINRSIILYYY